MMEIRDRFMETFAGQVNQQILKIAKGFARFKGLATDEGVDFLRRFGVEVVQYGK